MNYCTVVIVNYNTGDLLSKVVNSVTNSEILVNIIVVDNLSTDGSMDKIESSPSIYKYHRDKNYGFADSCNFGAQFVETPLVLFLNPDCLIQDDTISKLQTGLISNPNAAIIGCMVNNPDGSEQRASRRRLPTFWRTFKTVSKLEKFANLFNVFAGVNLNHQKLPKGITQVEAISGAFILIKTEVFNEIGGFDNSFPLHFEDLDLFKRTLDHGYEILLNPDVKVIHYQGTSSKSNPKVDEFKRRGLKRYFYKHGSKLSQFIINLLLK